MKNTIITIVALVVGLLACDKASAEPPQVRAKVITEWVGKTPNADIYRFDDRGIRCYVADVAGAYQSPTISCVPVK